MLQTTYGKNGTRFDIVVPDDFQAELDALSPRMAYCAEYGIKQSIADAYAAKGLASADIIGKGLKKWDSIVAGTVRVAGSGDRQPTRTPMEREMWRIAAFELKERFAKKKTPKDQQPVYVRMLLTRDWDRLESEARDNLENADAINEAAFSDLEDLFAAADDES